MGNDLRVSNVARVSMGKWKEAFDAKDERLIHYLSSHDHWTPFAHCMVSIRETVPIFVARQRFKHTIGFVYNEESRRYVDDDPKFYHPSEWRARAENVKQGSSSEIIDLTKYYIQDAEPTGWFDDYTLEELLMEGYQRDLLLYQRMIKVGVAPEMARMVLPQSMMTSYIVTGSLYAWANAFRLRSDTHAQKEIQYLAEKWNTIINPLFPCAWKELTDA
jgi:thymidylate synthase (FAD)